METVFDEIKEKISNSINIQTIDVKDNTYMHSGHAGAGGLHIILKIVSEAFKDVSIVNRHQMIYRIFQDEIASGKIHAISMDLKSPDEI